ADQDRDVDVAELQSKPRLEERPGAVHLDVALVDGWPRTHAVDIHDERERHAGQVVATAGDGELELAAVEPGLLQQVVDAPHDELWLRVVEPPVRPRLRRR